MESGKLCQIASRALWGSGQPGPAAHFRPVPAIVKMARTNCVCSGGHCAAVGGFAACADAACPLRVVTALWRTIQRQKSAGVPLHPPDVPLRGPGGAVCALSAKREEVPLGCNLGKAAAISPMVFLLFGMCREIATSASGLLAMTNLGALCQKQCSACCKPPWRSPSAPGNYGSRPVVEAAPDDLG